jgi:hypothetical protein
MSRYVVRVSTRKRDWFLAGAGLVAKAEHGTLYRDPDIAEWAARSVREGMPPLPAMVMEFPLAEGL